MPAYFYSVEFEWPLYNNFLKLILAVIDVTITARVSEIGSARNTALTLFSKNIGNIYISGINNTIFLSRAKYIDVFALPNDMKVC